MSICIVFDTVVAGRGGLVGLRGYVWDEDFSLKRLGIFESEEKNLCFADLNYRFSCIGWPLLDMHWYMPPSSKATVDPNFLLRLFELSYKSFLFPFSFFPPLRAINPIVALKNDTVRQVTV